MTELDDAQQRFGLVFPPDLGFAEALAAAAWMPWSKSSQPVVQSKGVGNDGHVASFSAGDRGASHGISPK